MREILFRGKHMAGGVWCEGNLAVSKGGVAIITPDNTPCGVYGQVDPDTVGQYTGLTDKNGKKIFEGDIVKYVKDGYVATGVARFGLYASAGAAFAGHEGFYLDWAGCDWLRKDIGFWATMRPIEVIGNVHDNPELMEDENYG